MQQYRVKDWDEFQHYKDRSPPWIRLHKRLLDNFRFHSLPDASRALAPMLWLLASENKDLNSGIIEGSDEEIAFRLRRTVTELVDALKPLIDKQFIEVFRLDSAALALRSQAATPETEAKTDRKETEQSSTDVAATPFQQVFDEGIRLLPGLMAKDTSPIRQWLNAGCIVEFDIVPTIKRLAEKRPTSWSYFTNAVIDAKATRERPLPPGTPRSSGPATGQTFTTEELVERLRKEGKIDETE